MNVPILWQHDNRWKKQRLGTKDGTTLGSHGCTVTCITMVNQAYDPTDKRMPNNIDDVFTINGGFVATDNAGRIIARSPQAGCNLVDWGKVGILLPAIRRAAWASYPDGTPADVKRIREFVALGGLVILKVFWKGNKGAMHFVVAVGSNGDDIIVNDPETGRQVGFSAGLFGSGKSANDIYAAHFFVGTRPPQTPQVINNAAGRGSGPVAQEDQVTQAQHDAAIAALNLQHQAEVAALKEDAQKMSNTINTLNTELDKYVPEYERTWKDGPVKEVLTDQSVILVDFSDQQKPIEYPANTIFTVEGDPFTVAGKMYYRTHNSVLGGHYYGVPLDALSESYAPIEVPTIKQNLNASQQLHAMVSDGWGFWQSVGNNIKSLFGGKK